MSQQPAEVTPSLTLSPEQSKYTDVSLPDTHGGWPLALCRLMCTKINPIRARAYATFTLGGILRLGLDRIENGKFVPSFFSLFRGGFEGNNILSFFWRSEGPRRGYTNERLYISHPTHKPGSASEWILLSTLAVSCFCEPLS